MTTNTQLENNVSIINDYKFEFFAALTNDDDSTLPINHSSIKRLVIDENVNQWWVSGYMVIDNTYNAMERPDGKDEEPDSFSYRFRNDGRDILLLKIRPILEGVGEGLLDDNMWTIQYVFSIYDIQDIADDNSPDNKYKKLFFWERDYQHLREKNIEWSTAQMPGVGNKKVAHLPDSERSFYSGEVIMEYLAHSLEDLKEQEFDEEKWDRGHVKTFYTSPSQNTCLDDLDYLLTYHISEEFQDTCLLRRNRFDKIWSLESLANIFSKAVESEKAPGEYQIEHFFIDSMDEKEAIIPSPYKTPHLKDHVSLYRNVNMAGYSIVRGFQYVDMSPLDNIFALTNNPVYSVSRTDNQFNFDYNQHSIINSKYLFTENYVTKLAHDGCKPDCVFTVNSLKDAGLSVNINYSVEADKIQRYACGRNLILDKLIYLNQNISFKVKGMTMRQPGRFIGIDREKAITYNDFDNKFLGQWFVTNVKHIFFDGAYVNEINAVKIHACDLLSINKAEEYPYTEQPADKIEEEKKVEELLDTPDEQYKANKQPPFSVNIFDDLFSQENIQNITNDLENIVTTVVAVGGIVGIVLEMLGIFDSQDNVKLPEGIEEGPGGEEAYATGYDFPLLPENATQQEIDEYKKYMNLTYQLVFDEELHITIDQINKFVIESLT